MDKISKLKKWIFFTSEDFHKHLLGLAKDCENYSQTDVYTWALLFLGITILTPLIYYKLMDNFRYSHVNWWIGVGGGIALLNAIILLWFFIRPVSMRCEELNFNNSNIWGFLFVDFIYAFIVYFLSSFFWKRFSKNHRNIPF